MTEISDKTIERLSLYRRILAIQAVGNKTNIFSYELAALANNTSAQVRRDFMAIGHSGNPRKGYDIKILIDDIDAIMNDPNGQKIALVGVGNLGRAIMAYFMGRRPKIKIAAAFDTDPQKTGRVISGCRCYPLERLVEIIRKEGIAIGIVTVPASAAQDIVNKMIQAGVKAIVNWAPTSLQVPDGIFIETRDITMSIEKAAYYAKTSSKNK